MILHNKVTKRMHPLKHNKLHIRHQRYEQTYKEEYE